MIRQADAPGLMLRPVREGGAFEDHEHDSHGHAGEEDRDAHDDHEDEAMHRDDHDDDHGHGHDHDDHDHEGDDHDHGPFDVHVWLDPINGWAMARAIAGALAEIDPANAAAYDANIDALLHRLDHLTEVIAEEVAPAGARRISELREKVEELGVVCVFDEPQFDKRLVRTVIEGSDVRSGTVDPLGSSVEDGPGL